MLTSIWENRSPLKDIGARKRLDPTPIAVRFGATCVMPHSSCLSRSQAGRLTGPALDDPIEHPGADLVEEHLHDGLQNRLVPRPHRLRLSTFIGADALTGSACIRGKLRLYLADRLIPAVTVVRT
jgi:hypothetical protein